MLASAQRDRVLELLRRHGWNATAFQILEPGFSYFFDGDDACVAYLDTGRAWVGAGAPIAPLERLDEVASRFVAAARAARRRALLFATEGRFVTGGTLASMRIGEQPVWDPRLWPETLRSVPSLREQLRRARAKGLEVRLVPPAELASGPTREALDELLRRWLATRQMAPMGFLVDLHPFSYLTERRCFVAERAGQVVGFLNMVPIHAREGWLLEDLLGDRTAPNGTSESLVDAALRTAAAEGATYATLGLAPLAGAVSRPLRAARRAGSGLFDFEGLRAFKARLRPQAWDPIFLSLPRGSSGAVALLDALTAFARGGLLRFGLQTLLRGPAVVIRVLALLLVPWTLMLASLSTRPWFPGPLVKWSWVTFDVLLAAALLELCARWRNGLATALATVVTLDALLTLVEAALWNARQPSVSLVEWAALAAAVLAPASAAFLLWRARAHRSIWM